MTQTPSRIQTRATETMSGSQGAPRKRSFSKSMRMVGAAAISATLVGVFALPAYASSPTESDPAQQGYAQALSTDGLVEISVPGELPTAEEQPIVVSYVSTTASAAPVAASGWTADVAASSLGSAIVNAAHSELGAFQDCTDLVQNALAAVGLAERRDQGGYDHGTISLGSFGTPVNDGQWAPGDILGWPGYPHVAIYIGSGLAIHGGMGGTTVVAAATGHFGTPSYVVRPG